jgi:hypothetical protein
MVAYAAILTKPVGRALRALSAGAILGAILAATSSTEFRARVAGEGVVCTSRQDILRLQIAYGKGRAAVIRAFPRVREIVLTDPDTGADRSWEELCGMVSADSSLLV